MSSRKNPLLNFFRKTTFLLFSFFISIQLCGQDLDSAVRAFKGYKVPNNVKSLGAKYWLRNAHVMTDIIIQAFGKPVTYNTLANDLDCMKGGWTTSLCGDFNNDGWIDVFYSEARNGNFFLLWDSTKKVFKDTTLLNNYTLEVIPAAFKPYPVYLNNDNFVDVVIFPADAYDIPVRIMLSDGSGRYDLHNIITNENDFFPNGAPPIMKYAGEVEDLNGDGLPDMYLPANSHAYIFWGIPNFPYFETKNHPRFHQITDFPGLSNNGFGETCLNCCETIFNAFIEDVNKDGQNDIVTIIGDKYDRILINNGAGRFNDLNNVLIPRYVVNGDEGDYMMMDLNEDGLNDFVVATGGGIGGKNSYNNIYAVIQKQSMKFEYDTTIIQFSSSFKTKKLGGIQGNLISHDFNNDGKLDIGFINASWGDDCGIYDSTKNQGNILPFKTVFIRERDKFIEKDYYQYDLYAKSLLNQIRKRFKCSPDALGLRYANVSNDFQFCQRDSIRINIMERKEGTGIIWHYGNKIDSSNVLSKFISDTGKVFFEKINYEFGCKLSSDTIILKYKDSPSPPVVRDTAYCANTQVLPLQAGTLPNHDIYWSDKIGELGAKVTPIANTQTLGEKMYYVTQENIITKCRSLPSALKVTVERIPNAPNVRDTSVCQNSGLINLSLKADTGNTLNWYGDQQTGGSSSQIPTSLSTNIAGNKDYYVSQSTKLAGCESPRAKFSVTINPTPNKPILNTSVFSFCSGDSLILSITNVNKGDTIKWFFDAKFDFTNTSTKSFKESGKVLVTRTDSVGCINQTDTIQVTRNEKPVKPSISWNGSELSIPATYTTYQWLLNNTVIAGATSATYKPVNAGLHRIRVTNSSGCADTSDAFNLVVTAAGRVTQNQNKVAVYPNPTTSTVFVDLGKSPSQPVSVQLLTIEGRPMTNWIMQQQRQEFAIDHIQNGTYLIQIIEGKTKTIHKVVIQTP